VDLRLEAAGVPGAGSRVGSAETRGGFSEESQKPVENRGRSGQSSGVVVAFATWWGRGPRGPVSFQLTSKLVFPSWT
jgi:hypothetical protein